MSLKFKVGDIVTWTNDYGVKFPERQVVGIDFTRWGQPHYHLLPNDAPWCAVAESALMLDLEDPVVELCGKHKVRLMEVEGEKWFLLGRTRWYFRTIEALKRFLVSPKAAAEGITP